MRIHLFCVVILCGSHFCSQAQAPGAADSLKAQATRMVDGLISGDYSTFIHYIHPKVIEASGGVAALKQLLAQMSRQWSVAGMSFQEVSLDSASAFIKKGTQLQATIRQHTTMKMPQGRSVATSTLIGMSVDNGLHWRFVDTNNKTLADVQQLLPNLSNALVIPPQQPPVHFDQY
jgi:hypothetical protein